jgi:hypothetical protein
VLGRDHLIRPLGLRFTRGRLTEAISPINLVLPRAKIRFHQINKDGQPDPVPQGGCGDRRRGRLIRQGLRIRSRQNEYIEIDPEELEAIAIESKRCDLVPNVPAGYFLGRWKGNFSLSIRSTCSASASQPAATFSNALFMYGSFACAARSLASAALCRYLSARSDI